MERFALLTVGKTHTGKSTFAKEIVSQIPNCVILETDPIAVFLSTTFPKLHALDLDHQGSFSSPSLKYRVFQTVLEFALAQNFNIILSNSNMYEKGRQGVFDIIKKYPAKTIGLHFNYPEELLSKRVEQSGRSTEVLSVSKDFQELIVNQRTRFQPPNPTDFDYFFEVKDPADLPRVTKEILALYQ